MERSALYRRALAPIMTYVGALGLGGAAAGRLLGLDSPVAFILFWGVVAFVALAGSFVLVRRQALRDAEPFWSPPTRRVAQAFLPPLVAGLLLSVVVAIHFGSSVEPGVLQKGQMIALVILPRAWVILYGCALHAAGFFMPRGMKILGWGLVVCGAGLFAFNAALHFPEADYAYGVMGFFFGFVQLGYGIYLYFTEKGTNGA